MNENVMLPSSRYPQELKQGFSSFSEWKAFCAANPFVYDPAYIAELAEKIRRDGFLCPFLNRHVPGSDIVFGDPNYREGILFEGLNSRLRAVIGELNSAVKGLMPSEAKIYAPEAFTRFALLMRSRFPRFVGSEYIEDPRARRKYFPIPHENLQNLSFPASVFDVVIVNDVFEHVPDIDQCLREIARVVRLGGRLISTFPFNIGSEEPVIRARLHRGRIQHLMEPQYHGNPVDPEGSLVFEIPGWNILPRVREAGWSTAEIVFETSVSRGILSNGFSGIFTLVAIR